MASPSVVATRILAARSRRAAGAAFALAGAAGALFAMAFVMAACAVNGPEVDLPTADPSVPALDASFSAEPAPGRPGVPGSVSDAGQDATLETPDATTVRALPEEAPKAEVAPRPAPGELLVTEIMADPNRPEPTSEWFEVFNAAAGTRDLGGLVLVDGSGRTATIGASVRVPSGAYVVLARDRAGAIAAGVPEAAIAYEYGAGEKALSGVLLANGLTGGIAVLDGPTILADVFYGLWAPDLPGRSIQLMTLDPTREEVASSWCSSARAWTAGSDFGSPGRPCDCP